MNLYEVDARLEELIDGETGEVLDYEALEALQMEREKLIEGIALSYKNAKSDIDRLTEEIEKLKDKVESAKRRQERCRELLTGCLGGDKFKTPLVSVWWQKGSESVEIADESRVPDAYAITERTIDRQAIKEALKLGEVLEGCSLVRGADTIRIR